MKSFNHFLLIIFSLLFVVGCKSVFSKQVKQNELITLKPKEISKFEYLKTDSDSTLSKRFLDYKIQKYTIDSIGNDYTSTAIFYSKDSILKVINLYGEYVGATYNPTSESYIINNDKFLDTVIYGETYRIDKVNNNKYLFYTDNYDRLSSNFSLYKVSFVNDSIQIEETTKPGSRLFDFINNRKETPENFPKDITNLFPTNPNLKPNDTASTFFDENYYPEEEFTSKNTSDVFTQLLYRKKFGDQIEKIAQIHHNDSISEIILSMRGGDSDLYTMSSEFVNDSIFVQTLVNQETIKDETNLMAYAFDSIITKYKYNDKFELQTISKDTFKYEKEYFKRYDRPVENHIFYSKPFKINNLNCYWKTTIEIIFEDDGKPLQAKNISRILINSITKKPILISKEDMIVHNETAFFDPLLDNFKDYNFDGYLDFSIYNFICSGGSHAFFDNYIFNPRNKKFEYDKKNSGAEITVDKNLKTITLYFSMGRMYHEEKIIHYSKIGKELFTESFIEEEVKEQKSDNYYIKKTYLKTKASKVIQKRITKEKN